MALPTALRPAIEAAAEDLSESAGEAGLRHPSYSEALSHVETILSSVLRAVPMVRLAPILDTARTYAERNAFQAAAAVISAVWDQTDGEIHARLRGWHSTIAACRDNPNSQDAWAAEATAWRALQAAVTGDAS